MKAFGRALGALAIVLLLAASPAFASESGDQTVWFSSSTIAPGEVVDGDLDIAFGSVVCEPGGVIRGDVRTFFGSFEAENGCEVDGRLTDAFGARGFAGSGLADRFLPPWFEPQSGFPNPYAENRKLFVKLGWDVVILFAFLLFPVRVRVALDRVERHPVLSAGAGFATLLAVLPVSILLLLSVIGIPVIPIAIGAAFLAAWIGTAAVAILVGRRLAELLQPHRTPSPLAALFFGLVVVTAAETLPVVGWVVSGIVLVVGIGATILAFVGETTFGGLAGANRASLGGPPNR